MSGRARPRFRLTPLGAVVLVLFCVAVAIAALGSGTAQIAGLAAALWIATFVVGGVRRFAYGGRIARVPEPEVLDEAPADPRAWQRERERREQDQADGTTPATGSPDAFGK
jgi:hypothetical protein